MARDLEDVAYLRIAGILRADIASGRIAAGGRLPSETQLMMRHHVSRSVAKWAIAVLKADGLVDGRQGSGVFVRSPLRLVRLPHQPGIPPHDQGRPDVDGDDPLDPWPYRSDEVRADADIADRLAIARGDLVLRVRYRLTGQGPLQLVTSWQPAADRNWAPDQLSEQVIVRPARPDEIEALGLPARGCVFCIARTYTTRGVPTETADIVLPIDRCKLIYQLPVH